METIFHIRRKLKPARGNQYYREFDPGRRFSGTYCGADPTINDVQWRDKAECWNHPNGTRYIPCPKCISTKQKVG